MLFEQTISKRININYSELIIDTNSKDKKSIPFSKTDKVYISFEKLVTTKNYFLVISFVTLILIILVAPYLLISVVIISLIIACYLSMNFYKSCTLKIELTDEKVSVRYISLDFRYELVRIVQDLRKNIESKKNQALCLNFKQQII